MLIELGNESKLIDSATPGYNSCGCGNRRYYTKAEIDEMLAGFLDESTIREILDNIFNEYIEEGDFEELIISILSNHYTNEQIDDLLDELENRIKNWVQSQGYLTDITLKINGRTLHNNGSITIDGGSTPDLSGYATKEWVEGKDYPTKPWVNDQINNGVAGLVKSVDYNTSGQTIDFYDKDNNLVDSIDASVFITDGIISDVYTTGSTLVIVFDVQGEEREIMVDFSDIFNPDNYYTKAQVDNMLETEKAAETARTENAYMKGDAIPYYISNHFVTANTEANVITVRMKYPQTGEVQDYTRFIKRINGINLITGTQEDDIYLPNFEDFESLLNSIVALQTRVNAIEDNCCGGYTPDTGSTPTSSTVNNTIQITYNVTSSTQSTKIVNKVNNIASITYNGNSIDILPEYTFPRTGLQTLVFTFTNGKTAGGQFSRNNQIVSAVIGNNVTLTNNDFAYSYYLTGVTFESGNTKNPGQQIFISCKRLTNITGLENVKWTKIPFGFCLGCENFTGNLYLPNTITYISTQAFDGTKPGIVTIPSGVTYLGGGTGGGIGRPTNYIRFFGTVPPDASNSSIKGSAPIYVPSSALTLYRQTYADYDWVSRIQAWNG